MYELNNKVRLIDVSGFPIKNGDEFVGFICGIISQDNDLEQIYLDSFFDNSEAGRSGCNQHSGAAGSYRRIIWYYFVISMSLDKEDVPAAFQDKISVAL